MSDQTRQALIDAIAAHIQDGRPGEELGEWTLATEVLTQDSDDAILHIETDGDSFAALASASIIAGIRAHEADDN